MCRIYSPNRTIADKYKQLLYVRVRVLGIKLLMDLLNLYGHLYMYGTRLCVHIQSEMKRRGLHTRNTRLISLDYVQ